MSEETARLARERVLAALVFLSSAAVLVVELVSLRLLAPYLGLTLETNTLVVGVALTGIALGSWAGGRAADVVEPARTLPVLLAASGAVVAATPFLVRATASGSSPDGTLLVAAIVLVVPAGLLSAVTPMVTKLRLTDLDETGRVVGSLSGVGTAGAIAGTVLTGFVLVSAVPVTGILVGLGALLVLVGLAVAVRTGGLRAAGSQASVVSVVAALVGAGASVLAPGSCDAETRYHCAAVQADPGDDGLDDGRALVLDGVRNSYVALDDPTHLEFEYVRAIAAVVDASVPAGEPVDAYHLGAGGVTLPRYLAETRPGSTGLVSEIDPGVVQIDRDELGLVTGDDLEVRVEDGRLGLGRLDDAAYDLVVGDAFSGVTVPWHLTTEEAVAEIDRVLADDGVYAMNVIDHGDLGFARAAAATLTTSFDEVAVLAPPEDLARAGDETSDGGNLVLVASDAPIDPDAVRAGLAERGTAWEALDPADLERWLGDADVLTDDHAPVDQLLTPY